jgi:alcohol dehydrogenase
MVELAEKAGQPRPEIEESGGCVVVRFQPGRYVAPQQIKRDLTKRQSSILQFLATKSSGLSRAEISKALRLPLLTVRDELERLRSLEISGMCLHRLNCRPLRLCLITAEPYDPKFIPSFSPSLPRNWSAMHSESAPSVLDFFTRTRLVCGPGSLSRLGTLAREYGASKVLIVTDRCLREAGHCEVAERSLGESGISCEVYDQVRPNPTSDDVDHCTAFARPLSVDLLVGLGGGSAMDCAKATNFLLTSGGRIHDYRGVGRATQPMLPLIAIPTTAGTGSEAQSFAVIADSATHLKMACGDVRAAARVAILDPLLTLTMPRSVTAATGIDAMTHALESWVTSRRTPISQMFARQAWQLLASAFATVLRHPDHLEARGRMLLGAFLAGTAIENSMLGAAHAAANPLTARFDTTHGLAVGMMMPHVIRWNATTSGQLYSELPVPENPESADRWLPSSSPERLAECFSAFLEIAGLPQTISAAIGHKPDDAILNELAADAVLQWTGTFNPRKMDLDSFLHLYQQAR